MDPPVLLSPVVKGGENPFTAWPRVPIRVPGGLPCLPPAHLLGVGTELRQEAPTSNFTTAHSNQAGRNCISPSL